MKTKNLKTLLFCFWIVLGANAQNYSGGNGTTSDPYQIANKADLKYLSENSAEWSKHFIQTADITFISTDFQNGGDFHNGGLGFIPIGDGSPFSGSYDGLGHSIDGLFNNTSSTMTDVGMFGYCIGATISNLHLTNVDITNSEIMGSNTGGMIGFMSGSSQLTNCSVSGNVSGYRTTGGLVGYSFGSPIVNCNANCTTTSFGGAGDAGGLVGNVSSGSTVSKSYSTGSVIGNNSGAGGLIGYSFGSNISECYSTCSVSETGSMGNLGGLVGKLFSSATLSNSYATGSVTGGDFTGGLVGYVSASTINNSYVVSNISSSGSSVGGLVGININGGSANNSFWDTDVYAGSSSIGVGMTTSQLQTLTTFTSASWDFVGETTNGTNDIWEMGICSSGGYPVFNYQSIQATPTLDEQLDINVCDNYSLPSLSAGNYYTSPNGGGSMLSSGTMISSNQTLYVYADNGVCTNEKSFSVSVTSTPLDQSISASQTTLCDNGNTDITLGSTEIGVNYFLRDDSDNSVVDGPIAGSGSSISLNTGNITSTTNYNVYATSQDPGALAFTGNTGIKKVSLGTSVWNSEFAGTTQLTVEAWVNRSATGSLHTIMSNYDGAYPMLFRIDNDKINFYINSGTNVAGTSNIPVGTWTHLAATYDGTDIKVFVNGLQENSVAYSTAFISSTNEMKIGGGLINNTEYFLGDIAEVRLWNIARSSSDILAAYNQQLTGNESGLVGYYKFGEGTGTIAYNSAANGQYHGTLFNNPAWVNGPFVSLNNCSIEMNQTVTINVNTTPSADAPSDVTECDSYLLPSLTVGDYYTGTGGTGTMLSQGASITSTQPIYVYADNGGCTDENTLTVTINTTPTADAPSNVTECDSYLLPSLTVGDYYTGMGGTGTMLSAGASVSSTQTLYVYAVNGTCEDENVFDVTINQLPDASTTLSGETISAINTGATYQWLDCDNGNALIPGETGQSFTATTNGNYAVELTENGCLNTSACVAITSVSILENSFGNAIVVYPNPTNGNFSIDLGSVCESSAISISDINGKMIYSISASQSQIVNLSINEPAGVYIISIQSNDKKAIIRLMKE